MLLEEAFEAPRPRARWVRPAQFGVAAIIACGLAATIVAGALQQSPSLKKTAVQQISVLRPPPPPPPPKVEEKLPEPEVKQEIKVPEPKQVPDQPAEQPPASDQLGLDAEGSGTGDSFGLVSKPGGTDITTIGGNGSGGDKFAWYAGIVSNEVERQLSRESKLRGITFRAQVDIWFADNGKVKRINIAKSSGDPQTDRLIEASLSALGSIDQKPPADMPQPIKLMAESHH